MTWTLAKYKEHRVDIDGENPPSNGAYWVQLRSITKRHFIKYDIVDFSCGNWWPPSGLYVHYWQYIEPAPKPDNYHCLRTIGKKCN